MKKKALLFEDSISVVALLVMALLPLMEVGIRWVYASGIPGSALWVQHLVLWVAFLGAAIAARRGELLSLSPRAPFQGRLRSVIRVLTAGTGVAVCAALAWGAWDLVAAEREGGRLLAFDLPVWIAQLVMPLGFAVIGVRIALRASEVWTWRLVAVTFVLLPVLLGFGPDLRGTIAAPVMFVLILLATVVGAPIFVGLGGIAAVLTWNNFDPLAAIPVETYDLTVKPILPTIPLFTLAGYVLAEGGTPKRLVRLFRALFGWMPGGVAVVGLLVCAFFTSFTGGSGVTILAMGGLVYPMLLREKHSPRFATGLLTSAGSLGLLLPPSLAVILYCVVAEMDVRRLFVSGLAPAFLEIGLVTVFVYSHSRRTGMRRLPFEASRAWRAVIDARWEIAIPVVVLGSILGGLATLVETAAVTALYAFLLEFVIRRNLSPGKDLLRVVGQAVTMIGGVLLILGVAMGLTSYLVIAEIPNLAVEWVQSIVESPLLFLALFNVFLLLIGCFMDIYSAIVVVVPLVAPLGQAFGIDPFHLGIIFLVNLELGYLTPPVGMNLFLASYRFRRPLLDVYRAAIPFLIIRACSVLLITYVPPLTRWLPNWLMGGSSL